MTTLALALAISVGNQSAPLTQAPPTPTAKAVIDQAVSEAKNTYKNVYVVFHASWCGWCKRHDAFMAMKEYKPFYDANYVVAHLTVLESEDHKKDENAGGADLMKKWGGEKAGLPYIVILDGKGDMLTNAMRPEGEKKSNIGHPATEPEVAWYTQMLTKTAKHAKEGEIKKISDYLKSQKF